MMNGDDGTSRPQLAYITMPSGHGSLFTARMQTAVLALLTEPDEASAARQAGIGLRTLQRWKQEEQFQVALRDAQRQLFG